jgi:NTE family protein
MNSQPNELAPILHLPSDRTGPPPRAGMALALSGGGYRAMLFHLGSLIRLNEAGLLVKLKRISSVSGGSITAGVLGLHWKNLTFVNEVASNFDAEVVQPTRQMADHTVDIGSVTEGLFSLSTISSHVEKSYDQLLFKGATLQDLPMEVKLNPPVPEFFLNPRAFKNEK